MTGKNVKGENGFINIDGEYGSSAKMTTIDDPDFWSYIEDGIKPLVEVLLKHGIETYGSCQGHYVPVNRRLMPMYVIMWTVVRLAGFCNILLNCSQTSMWFGI